MKKIIQIMKFVINNWKAIKEAKKEIVDIVAKYKIIREDGAITKKEKDQMLKEVMEGMDALLPLLTEVWKLEMKKKLK